MNSVQACASIDLRSRCYSSSCAARLYIDQVRRLAGGSGSAFEGVGTGEREAEAAGCGTEPGQAPVEGHRLGKFLSPERRRCAVNHAQKKGMSERRACHWSTSQGARNVINRHSGKTKVAHSGHHRHQQAGQPLFAQDPDPRRENCRGAHEARTSTSRYSTEGRIHLRRHVSRLALFPLQSRTRDR
jgi:hypothetical protein